jgi:hypothetical protein
VFSGVGPEQSRTEFHLGLEGILWFVNAFGLGMESSIVGPSWNYRWVPSLAVRVLHYRREGALAIRFGLPYDTAYQWGASIGLQIQFSGVPQIGD